MLGFRSSSVAWMAVTSIVSLAFGAIFVIQYPSAVSWVLGQAVGAVVGALGAWLCLRRHKSANHAFSDQAECPADLLDRTTILAYCIPLATATGLMWLQNTGYRFWVGTVWGAAELGLLAIGLGISAQLWAIVENLASQFLYPYFYRHITEIKDDSQTGEALSDLLNVLGPVYTVLAAFNALFAAVLLQVLTNDRYHSAAVYVLFGAVIEVTRCTTNLWSNAAQVKCRTKGVILPWGLGSMTVIGGAAAVRYWNGGVNAFSAVLVSAGIVTCFSMIFIMRRVAPAKIDTRRWISGFAVMGICLAVAVIKPLSNQGIYQNLGLLLVGGTLACACMAAMLWRNPALSRLLSVPLRSV